MNGFVPSGYQLPPQPPSSSVSPGAWIGSTAVFMSIFLSTFLLSMVLAVYCCRLCRDRVRSDDDERARGGGSRSGVCPFPVEALPAAFAYAGGNSDDDRRTTTHGGGGGGGRECAVCLGAVLDGEMVRRLPACEHVYHAECIDRWLAAHRTCPLCRSELDPGKVAAGPPAPAD
ncbi:RING-H2 finger protein ATL39-like [Oryza brachyantha]|uniref:RING-H2 finger protein ATL39-like n=1 Tax=Oryza brachyantha TaxID=4533 RepID=UPI001ADC4FA0|nr:RING-H2 finger protein ATL39-like [Oryza brachyantha]